MIEAHAYVDAHPGDFGGWLETYTDRRSPRTFPAAGGGRWEVTAARELVQYYDLNLAIEARLVRPSGRDEELAEGESLLSAINFHVEELGPRRTVVWITCGVDDLDDYCLEILTQIPEVWSTAKVSVTSPKRIVPPWAASGDPTVLDQQLVEEMKRDWKQMRLVQRRIKVAAKVRKGVHVGKIAEEEGVSPRTTYRDIEELEKKGLL